MKKPYEESEKLVLDKNVSDECTKIRTVLKDVMNPKARG